MFFFTNTATNTSTTAISLTWNQETYNKIICRNNKTKDWASKMDCIIQVIKAMVGLKEKTEKLVRIADIINNTIADIETGILLTREGYYYEIPKKEQVSHTFKHLIANIKLYNADKI